MRTPTFLILLVSTIALVSSCSGVAGDQAAGVGGGTTAVAAETSLGEDNPAVRQALMQIKKAPDSPVGYTSLAVAYIRLARETGNNEYNTAAEAAIEKALGIDKNNVPARKLQVSLLLTGHEFGEALVLARELQAELPNDPFVWGLLTDANAELGNYAEAVTAAQKMVDLRPDAVSYNRVGYIRSLHGDSKGAIEAFTMAARMTGPGDREARSWSVVQVANEHWRNGRYDDAVKVYDEALQNFPDYYLALEGKGRAVASKGDFAAAADLLKRAQAKHLNLDAVFLLGDVYTRLGDMENARLQYELAQSDEQRLGAAYDPHRVALFWADRGINLDEAVRIAEEDYTKQKDIYASDTLAWCLYKAGRLDEAKRYAAEAMRIGTPDAKIFFHAGMIAKARGERQDALRLLERAIKLNPQFDPLLADEARSALNDLKKTRS